MTEQQLIVQKCRLSLHICKFFGELKPQQPTHAQCVTMLTTATFETICSILRVAGCDRRQSIEKAADILTDAALCFGDTKQLTD